MSTNTVHLHRVLTAKPEKIYRAFLDRDAMAKWLPPNGYLPTVIPLNASYYGSTTWYLAFPILRKRAR